MLFGSKSMLITSCIAEQICKSWELFKFHAHHFLPRASSLLHLSENQTITPFRKSVCVHRLDNSSMTTSKRKWEKSKGTTWGKMHSANVKLNYTILNAFRITRDTPLPFLWLRNETFQQVMQKCRTLGYRLVLWGTKKGSRTGCAETDEERTTQAE